MKKTHIVLYLESLIDSFLNIQRFISLIDANSNNISKNGIREN